MNNQTPNRRPTSGTGAPQNKQPARPATPTGAKPTNGARPATGAKPAAGARPTGTRPAGAKPASTAKPTGTGAKPPQKPNGGKKGKLGKDGILAIIMLLLVVVLAAIIIICCVKAVVDSFGDDDTDDATKKPSRTTASTSLKDPHYTTPVLGSWNYGYETTNRSDKLVNEGHLILVNNDYAYTFPASLKLEQMYNKAYGYGDVYVLGNGMTYPTGAKPLELSKDIVENISAMLRDMKAANPTLTNTRRLMILSGYRTLEKQETLYANDPDSGLTAKPGHSEHHTGLTFDIRINVKDQTEIEYLNEAEQAWITTNCAKYGFILRYTEDNKSVTQIGGEDWHFRYVGVAHATYMVEHDLCLEEYISFLKEKHTYGVNKPLSYSAEGTNYTIYYFPASVEKDSTDIYVPASGHYEISGNNIDGFIVTVTHEK